VSALSGRPRVDCVQEMDFAGYHISGDGVSPLMSNVERVQLL
jgi:hypothetical protein